MKAPKLGGYERLRKPWRVDADGRRNSDPLAPLHAGLWSTERFACSRPGPTPEDIEQEIERIALKRWLAAADDWKRDRCANLSILSDWSDHA